MNKEIKATEVCKECRFMHLCIELEYPLNCVNEDTCERYADYLEGMEEYES